MDLLRLFITGMAFRNHRQGFLSIHYLKDIVFPAKKKKNECIRIFVRIVETDRLKQ